MSEFSYESFIKNHIVFEQLKDFKNFYFSISENSSRKPSMGIQKFIPLDSYFFESIMNTIDSLIILLEKGRLGDSYALLRKYEDLTLFQTYLNIKIKEEFSIDNLIVKDVNKWFLSEEKAPRIKKIDEYLKKSDLIRPIYALYEVKDKKEETEIEKIRERCNDFMHLNNIKSIIFQNAETLFSSFEEEFNQFQKDSLILFSRHFAFTLYLNGEYITDEDYFVALDAEIFKLGEEEPWVSPIIQLVFDKYVKTNNPKLAKLITNKLGNDLE
ncbi:MAG: hypothetical protein H3C31_13155 [Brumimicrobium sp.]|nr:hypothetical protein [Brumimicrobium sp.]